MDLISGEKRGKKGGKKRKKKSSFNATNKVKGTLSKRGYNGKAIRYLLNKN
jgi:hypothetical protein